MAIAQQTLGTGATTLYTSSGTTATTAVYLTNDSASSVTIQVYVVPNGGSATAATRIIKDLVIAGADTYCIDIERIVLDNGDTIQASASTGSVIYSTISYVGM